MATATLPPPEYRLSGLIRDLERPEGDPAAGYEARLGLIGEQYETPLARPYIKGTRALPLPTREMARALGATSGNGGDLTVGSIERVAAAVRPELVFGRLGVPTRTVRGLGPIGFPVFEPGAISGGWGREGGTGRNAQPTVKSAQTAPKTAISFVQFSRQLLLQSEALEEDLLTELTQSTEAVHESGFLAGSGSENEPHGILLQATGALPYGGAVPTRPELVAQVKAYTNAKGTLRRAAWILNSDLAADLMEVETSAGSGKYVAEIDAAGQLRILGIRAEISDYMPDGKVLLFDPLAVRTTYWGEPFALLNRWTDGMDIRNEARLVIWSACDVAVKHPQLLVVGTAS